MKKKQREEIKVKEIGELRKLIGDSQELIFKLNIEKSQNKLKNLRQVFNEKKKIALMKTLINEKIKLKELAKTDKAETKTKKTKKVRGGSK